MNAQKPRLAIGMPSNRPLAQCLESVESAVNFCRKNNHHFTLSDNSGDAAKAQKLQGLMQGMSYLPTPPTGMIANWFNAFNNTDGDFVLMMGDDDTIFSFGSSPSFTDLPPDVVGIKPSIAAYADGQGILRINSFGLEATNAPGRIQEFREQSAGMNLGIFTFWRRDVLKSIMTLLFQEHPTKGTYCDWALMHGLASSGRVIRDPMSCYFYNLQNWVGDEAFIAAQVDKAFTKSGLPAGTSAYHLLLNAIDSYIFVNRQDSPLEKQDRFLAAILSFDAYLKTYVQNIPQNSTHANAAFISALSQQLVGNDNIANIFAITADILEAIQPELGQKYKAFHLNATGADWGTY